MGAAGISAIRAFRIFEYFESAKCPLRLKAIAEYLDIPISSAAAILKNLTDLDYLSYDVEARTYLPTLRLATLGRWVPNRIQDDGVAGLVQNLMKSTKDAVVLTTMNDLFLDFIFFRIPDDYWRAYPQDVQVEYPRGMIAINSPFAWVLMRNYRRDRIERIYLRSRQKKLFNATEFTMEDLAVRIDAARRSKYIFALNWPHPSTALLVTTLPVSPFGRSVALGIGTTEGQLRKDRDSLIEAVESELARLPASAQAGLKDDQQYSRLVIEVDAQSGMSQRLRADHS